MRKDLLCRKINALLLVLSLAVSFIVPWESAGESFSKGVNSRQCSSYAYSGSLVRPADTDELLPEDETCLHLQFFPQTSCKLRIFGLWDRSALRIFACASALYGGLWLCRITFTRICMMIIRYIHSKDGRKDAVLFC